MHQRGVITLLWVKSLHSQKHIQKETFKPTEWFYFLNCISWKTGNNKLQHANAGWEKNVPSHTAACDAFTTTYSNLQRGKLKQASWKDEQHLPLRGTAFIPWSIFHMYGFMFVCFSLKVRLELGEIHNSLKFCCTVHGLQHFVRNLLCLWLFSCPVNNLITKEEAGFWFKKVILYIQPYVNTPLGH